MSHSLASSERVVSGEVPYGSSSEGLYHPADERLKTGTHAGDPVRERV